VGPHFITLGVMSVHGTTVFEEISPAECHTLLGLSSVGRVAVSVNALPVILPVNYAWTDGDVVFRTSAGTKLAAATAGAVVAFEVDQYDHGGTHGWSVLVQGRAAEIVDPVEIAAARMLPLHSWALDGDADHYVRIRTATISGRRFRPVEPRSGPDDTIR